MYKKYSSFSRPEMQQRLVKFGEDSSKYKNVIFCVNCGSTNIDQNSITELRCYSCHKSIVWNSFSFGIARNEQNLDDVFKSLTRLNKSSYDEWHEELTNGLLGFLEEVLTDAAKSENFTRERLLKLERTWEHYKKVVDMYFNDRKQFDEEIS